MSVHLDNQSHERIVNDLDMQTEREFLDWWLGVSNIVIAESNSNGNEMFFPRRVARIAWGSAKARYGKL